MVVQHSWAFDVHGHSAITVIPKLTLALDRINRPIAEPGILRKVAPVGSIEKFCRQPQRRKSAAQFVVKTSSRACKC